MQRPVKDIKVGIQFAQSGTKANETAVKLAAIMEIYLLGDDGPAIIAEMKQHLREGNLARVVSGALADALADLFGKQVLEEHAGQ